MKDFFQAAGAVFLVIFIVLAILVIVSLPFAFIGWILLLAVNIFGDVGITYISCVILGIAAAILGHLMSR